jgi:DNA polymerase-3 subunit delta'
MDWGVIGHEWAVNLLAENVALGHERHAYLFTGPSGIGRRTLALRFAQSLNCQTPSVPGQPCRTCSNCMRIEQMHHPDLIVVMAENEGETLKIDQVRELQHTLSLAPYEARYRIAMILRFEEANSSSANAMLKTLEEPPDHVVIILTAKSAENLLPTIVSRCEVLRLRPLPVGTVEGYLKEHGADEGTAHLLAHVSGGRPGYALRLMQDKETLDFRAKRLQDLQELLRSNRRERFAYADKLTDKKNEKSDARERLRETFLLWLSFWRDVLLCASRGQAPLANVDRVVQIEALAGKLSLAEARRMVEAAEGAIDKLERNVNPRLLTEVLLLDWPHE